MTHRFSPQTMVLQIFSCVHAYIFRGYTARIAGRGRGAGRAAGRVARPLAFSTPISRSVGRSASQSTTLVFFVYFLFLFV